jgi:hypothetical protein
LSMRPFFPDSPQFSHSLIVRGFVCVPSMNDSLEVEVLCPA